MIYEHSLSFLRYSDMSQVKLRSSKCRLCSPGHSGIPERDGRWGMLLGVTVRPLHQDQAAGIRGRGTWYYPFPWESVNRDSNKREGRVTVGTFSAPFLLNQQTVFSHKMGQASQATQESLLTIQYSTNANISPTLWAKSKYSQYYELNKVDSRNSIKHSTDIIYRKRNISSSN